MNVLIISLCKEKLSEPEYVAPIIRALDISDEDYHEDVAHYTDELASKVKKADVILLSGTALKDFDYLDHLDSFSWLKETTKPVLGICGGMQVIALTHDAQLKDKVEIGMIYIEPEIENPLIQRSFHAYTLHNKTVEPNDKFEILAKSKDCVHAIRHRNLPQYGVLFHPEVRNQQVIVNFLLDVVKGQ